MWHRVPGVLFLALIPKPGIGVPAIRDREARWLPRDAVPEELPPVGVFHSGAGRAGGLVTPPSELEVPGTGMRC